MWAKGKKYKMTYCCVDWNQNIILLSFKTGSD